MNFLKKLFSRRKEEPVELPPEFLQETPPDWLIDLRGQQLPDGNSFSIRVQLVNSSRAGSIEVIILPRQAGDQPHSATIDLPRLAADRLFVILGFSFPNDITGVATEAIDGLPITLAIHRADPYAKVEATCNLAGWMDSRKSRPPAVEIGVILFENVNSVWRSVTGGTK